MTNSLKPLDFRRNLISVEEALAELEGYQPSDPIPVSSPNPEPIQASTDILGRYVLMAKTNTYAQGVHSLRDECGKEGNSVHPQFVRTEGGIYRPLTFKENLQARVEVYESHTGDERLKLFGTWLDSCCGVAYKKRSTRFKLIPICEELVTINQGFSQKFIPINYDSIQGVELDSRQAKYRELLTKQEVLDHPAWLTVVEEDRNLLKAYSAIVSSEKKQDKLMRFLVLNNFDQDQLRALFVFNICHGSGAIGSDSLISSGSFLRVVAPQGAP